MMSEKRMTTPSPARFTTKKRKFQAIANSYSFSHSQSQPSLRTKTWSKKWQIGRSTGVWFNNEIV